MSNVEPVFTLDPDSGLYFLRHHNNVGFRPSGAEEFYEHVTLRHAFGDPGGVFFCCNTAPASTTALAEGLTAWLARQPDAGPRFLWLDGVNHNHLYWQISCVTMARVDEITTVRAGTMLDLGGIQVQLHAGCTVMPAFHSEFYGWGLVLNGASGLTLFTEEGRFPAVPDKLCLSFDLTYAGCLVWQNALDGPGTQQPTPLQRFGGSLRYFAADRAACDGTVAVLRVDPLIQQTALTLYATLDPFKLFDPIRSRVSFYQRYADEYQPIAFGSRFTSANGQPVSLTAAVPSRFENRTVGLMLAVQPLVTGTLGSVPTTHYFTLSGAFDIAVSEQPGTGAHRHDGDTRLLCGWSGTEYLRFEKSGGSLHFKEGHAAFAPKITPQRITAANAVARLIANDRGDEAPAGGPSHQTPNANLTTLGTTAWIAVAADLGVADYCAQGEDTAFYTLDENEPGYLRYFEIATARLNTHHVLTHMPMLCYRGMDPADLPLARMLETRAIAPARRFHIAQADDSLSPHVENPESGNDEKGLVVPVIAPSGLAVYYGRDGAPWPKLVIGNTGQGGDPAPDLFFSAVHGPFREAMMSNRLFMVLGDAETVMASASVAYQLTQAGLGLIAGLPRDGGVSATTMASVSQQVTAAGFPVYPTEAAFNRMLDQATKHQNPPMTETERRVFLRFAGLLTPRLGDWLFRLSPRNWVGAGRRTQLIFKFVGDRSLRDLISDPSVWLWPEACGPNGDTAAAKKTILARFVAAEADVLLAEQTGTRSAFETFVQVINNPAWTGVLALDVAVPLETLPAPLQPLAAGMNPGLFTGHHLGLTSTGFRGDGNGGLAFDTTATFGLVDYADDIDQTFSSDDVNFAFKVQRLQAAFDNGLLTHFSSTAQLLVNRLFGTQTRFEPTAHGNNLMLDGVYQDESSDGSSGRGTYVFALRSPGELQLSMGELRAVAVESVRMGVVRATDPENQADTVQTLFQLAGRLRFAEARPDFDPFCWGPPQGFNQEVQGEIGALGTEVEKEKHAGNGFDPEAHADDVPPIPPGCAGLAFRNYAISMRFKLSDPRAVTFGVVDENLTLDTAGSPARVNSLFARFPLRLVDFISCPDPWITQGIPATSARENHADEPEPLAFAPESAGFVSISAPIRQGRLSAPWFGLVYEVDLGSLGALAGSVGFSLRLLAAWSPGGFQNTPAVYLGAALPGVSEAVGMNLPLQGLLDLGFRTVQFETHDQNGDTHYLMRLRDFGLQLMGMTFPPGHNDITLFGNPEPGSDTKLGWYAAFEVGKLGKLGAAKEKAKQKTTARALRKARPARAQRAKRGEA